jgi:hypothetical protein
LDNANQAWRHEPPVGAEPHGTSHVHAPQSSSKIPLFALGAGFLIGGICFLVSPDDATEVMAASITPLAFSFVFFRCRN